MGCVRRARGGRRGPRGRDGLDVVELGCGTAYFSAWLARRGARPVGVDVTPAQLDTARRVMARDRDRVPARRGERGGRAAARRLVRPGRLGVRRLPLVRPGTLGAGGRSTAPARRPARVPDEQHAGHPLRPRRAWLHDRAAAASAEGPAPDHVVVRGRRRVLPSATASGSISSTRAASRSSASSSSTRPRARRHTSTTTARRRSGRAGGLRRTCGQPASAPDPRVDEPAAPRDPRAARDPVRRRRTDVRRAEPPRRRARRARARTRGGEGALGASGRARDARRGHHGGARRTCVRQAGRRGGRHPDAARPRRAHAHGRVRGLPPWTRPRRHRARGDRRDVPCADGSAPDDVPRERGVGGTSGRVRDPGPRRQVGRANRR